MEKERTRKRIWAWIFIALLGAFYVLAFLAPYLLIRLRVTLPDLDINPTIINGLYTVSSIMIAAQIFLFKEISFEYEKRKVLCFVSLFIALIILAIGSLVYAGDYLSLGKATIGALYIALVSLLFGLATINAMTFSIMYGD